MNYELLIFDWDGTLIDSAGQIVQTLQQSAAEVGLPVPSDYASRQIIGLGLGLAMEELFPGAKEEQIHALVEAYRRLYVQPDKRSALFKGAREALADLREQGYRLTIATGKSRAGLDRVLNELNMTDWFEFSRCADETHSKPHPAMVLEILEHCWVDASDAVVIGDTEFDIKMAQAAKVDAVAVSGGAHDDSRLQAAEPLTILPNVTALPQWLAASDR